MSDSKLNNSSVNDAPDARTLAAESSSPNVNALKARATESAGAKGSNHIGQGSSGDSTHRAHTPNQPIRKGNSETSSFDADEAKAKEPKGSDKEINLAGGAERAAKNDPSKTSPEKRNLPQP